MSKRKKIGQWAFIIGVILAFVIGLLAAFMNFDASTISMVMGIMAVLGLIVGAVNVTDKEISKFIIAAIGLTVGATALASMGSILSATAVTAVIGKMIITAFTIFGMFVAGAVFIPALKAVYEISND